MEMCALIVSDSKQSLLWTIKRAKQNEAKTFLETLNFLFIFRFEKVFESQT